MANQIFMRVNEVAEELGISIPFAYRIIQNPYLYSLIRLIQWGM